jgi:hypothetical protein
MAKKYGFNVMSYSFFLKSDFILKLFSVFVRLFKLLRIEFLYNKFRGLRSKLLKTRINEDFIRKIIILLEPRICFYDNIGLISYGEYPYGSYFIRKVSGERDIKNFSICTGGSSYLFEINRVFKPEEKLNYDRIYVPNEQYEKKVYTARSESEKAQVLALGDPRFDSGWMKELKETFAGDVKNKLKFCNLEGKAKILYLCPNLEWIEAQGEKYSNLRDIAILAKEMGCFLFVKPHPRYRNTNILRSLMKKIRFEDYYILDDDPLIAYVDYVDYVISFATSAVNDFLPGGYKKVIIYDNFFEKKGVENIFKNDFNYFDNYASLSKFLKEIIKEKKEIEYGEGKLEQITQFYKNWACAGRDPATIIEAIGQDLIKGLK